MIKQETQKKMGEYHFQPFRNPSIFTGERNQNPEKWLKEFHRVARYNCWDDSMCLANVYFFLQGTAHRWYENVEEKINSWDIFVKMFSQNFGHHVTQKDQLAENLKTRAQGKEETSDSYIQDVLHLCRKVNPAMMENEIVAHLTKGISEEIYQSIIILDIASIDEFIKWCRKIEASNKKRVNKRVVFDRLPNVAAIDSADSESMEDLIRRIVREEVHRALNPEPPYKPIPTPLQSRKKLSVASSFEGEAAGVKNPPSSTAAKLQQNYVEIIIDDIAFSALVDSGSSFSVISDGLRRQLKKTMFKDSGMTLKVADGKNVTSIGRCTISLSINGLEQPLEFIVLPNSNPTIILGWDFLEASNAVIDCGRAEIRLEEAKDVLNSPASMGKVVASRSVVIPAESTKLINVMSEELNGQNQVLFEPSKKVLIGKGLTLPCALFRLSHNKGKLWIVNSSTTAQIVPKGMCLGKIQRVEENNLTAISECSEFNKEVKNANHASHADKSDFKFLQNLISDDLSEEQQSQILSILKRYEKIFDKNNEPVKQTSVTKHKIETGNHQPIKHRPYRVSPTERQAIQTEVDKMLDAGIIRHSESPWSSPVILVKKKDGNWRFCVDYRRLNKVTKKDVYPLPRIDDTLDSLKGAKFYSSMDLRSGYWQIEVDEADREKTAFITPDGLYEFLVMPFGLCNAPATFERMMDKILKGLKWTMALCYLDDIVVYSKSFNEHLHRLEIILQCLDEAELRLNPKKCLFGTKRIRVFGHLVDSKGIYPDPEKIEAIAKFPTPKSITDVRSFIGLCSYYRRFIENFAEKSAPLHEVLKKDNKFTWNSDQQDAFDSLKKALMSEPVLAYFEEQLPTELHTDASGYGIGAVLVQINDGKERPVGYASRTLSKAEKNYSTTERECLAAIWAINKFRPYLFGREFVIVTDHHALCWLSNLKDPTGRLSRWALKLQEYNVTVVYKSGRKHQDADCLSRNPLQLESEEAYNDEDDDIPSITALTCFEAEQRKDPKINKLIDETEIFGAESKGYEMLKGTLYKKNFDPLGNQHLLVIPKHLRLELLKSLHDAPTAGHLGFSKTYERVKNKYFWPGLLRDIRKYVAHCKECQRKKQSTQKPPGLLKAIPPASSPLQRVGMDLLGRFPKSDTGNKWIIVCTDYLTRFAVTKALPTGEAKEAAKFLMEDVVLKHGAPREIITDRGRVFQSKLIAELTNQCSSIHRFTTAYHPQTNGLTERLNKTLANMIAMYVSVEQKDWDVILPYVTFAYNTAKQDTTGFTPFKLIHGREAETTVDTLFPNPHEDLQEDYSQKIASRVEETRQLARLETLKAQEKDKARYDSKHEAMDYNVGDLVWIFIPIRNVGLSEKLMKRYFGPYRVTRKLSDVTFEVEPVDQPTRRRQTRDLVHVLRMKPYHDPEDQADLFKALDDARKRILLDNHLRGAAREFALQSQQIRLGYEELKESLERRFRKRVSTREWRSQFFSCRQGAGEKVRDFAARVSDLAAEAESDGLKIGISEVAEVFIDGLCPSLWEKAHLYQGEPWETLVAKLQWLEQREEDYREAQCSSADRNGQRLGDMGSKLAELEKKMEALEIENTALRRQRGSTNNTSNGGGRWPSHPAGRRDYGDNTEDNRRGAPFRNWQRRPAQQPSRQQQDPPPPRQEKRNPNGEKEENPGVEYKKQDVNPGRCPGHSSSVYILNKERSLSERSLKFIIDSGSEANIVNIDNLSICTEGLNKPTYLKGISGKSLRSLGSEVLEIGAVVNGKPIREVRTTFEYCHMGEIGFDGILGLPGFRALKLHLSYDGSIRSDYERKEDPTKSAFLSSLQTIEMSPQPPRIPLNEIRTGEDIFRAFSHCFCRDIRDMGNGSTITAPKLRMLTSKPVYRRQYPNPNRLVSKVKTLVDELEEVGIIKGSTSLWNSPLFPVAKTDGSVRITMDLRMINEATEFFPFPIPRVEDNLRAFAGAKVFSTLDLTSGFFQIHIPESDRDYFTFSLPWGRYRFTRLPQGAKNSAQVFQWAMNLVLGDLLFKCVRLYIDDVIVYSDSHEQHVADITAVLERLSKFGLKAKYGKSYLFRDSVEYLGHVIDQNGIKPMWDNVAALRDLKRPHNIKAVRSLLGTVNYYRRFISNAGEVLAPLSNLLRKGHRFAWGMIEQSAFETVKEILTSEPLLIHPTIGIPFILNTDASGIAVGACLQQEVNGTVRPIAYYSKRLTGPEIRYSTIEKEAYAVVLSLQHFKHLLAGSRVEVHTDHKPITYNKGSDYKNARLSRWAEIIQDFNVTFIYVPGKENTVADFLSRFPCEDDPNLSQDRRVVAAVDNFHIKHTRVHTSSHNSNTHNQRNKRDTRTKRRQHQANLCTTTANTTTLSTRNIETIHATKQPHNRKTLRSFLSAVNAYKKFIPDHARLRTPLVNLLKRDVMWVWDDECQKAFTSLKESLTTHPTLHLYQEGLPCQVYCNASTLGIAGVLKQVHPDGKTYTVQNFSRALRAHERNYPMSELQCLAIVESVENFRVSLMDRKFAIFSDHHALQWLTKIKNPSGKLFRWRLRLSRYEYEVRNINGVQQYETGAILRNPFCGFLDASLIKSHQPSPSGKSSLTMDHNGLHTVSRKG
ncbi:hypothetical protein LAZ67_16000034, partial [Cordylochernes scorpioides]